MGAPHHSPVPSDRRPGISSNEGSMQTTYPVIIGVDTHKATHVAVVINMQGARLGALSIPANPKGYQELERWALSFGKVLAFGIEGTGSYGAGLSRALLARGHTVLEVTRPHRQLRYSQGKTDSLDAEGAARSVLAGQATAQAKTQIGSSEMIRHLKIARDTAVKSRSQAMVTLKTLIINAPAALREALDQVRGKVALIRHVAALRPGDIDNPMASAKLAMRALARRWLCLHEEIVAHDKQLERLVSTRAPELMMSHGIAALTVAEMLILVGDNPTSIRSEAAFAKLCGVCPIPASSGRQHAQAGVRKKGRKMQPLPCFVKSSIPTRPYRPQARPRSGYDAECAHPLRAGAPANRKDFANFIRRKAELFGIAAGTGFILNHPADQHHVADMGEFGIRREGGCACDAVGRRVTLQPHDQSKVAARIQIARMRLMQRIQNHPRFIKPAQAGKRTCPELLHLKRGSADGGSGVQRALKIA